MLKYWEEHLTMLRKLCDRNVNNYIADFVLVRLHVWFVKLTYNINNRGKCMLAYVLSLQGILLKYELMTDICSWQFVKCLYGKL